MIILKEPTLLEKSRKGAYSNHLGELDMAPIAEDTPDFLLRDEPIGLPEVTEPEVVRHLIRLSQLNFSVDTHFYPLGSCTMKYNPKLNDILASLPPFAQLHPYEQVKNIRGIMSILYDMQTYLGIITGLPEVSLQPAAGANGEFAGISLIREYFKDQGEDRPIMIIPDSAHGTNPASASVAGFEVLTVPSNSKGMVDIEALSQMMSPKIAGIMLTNPNTLGLFEEDILEIANIMHKNGSLLYYDGANLNALVGLVKPGDMGFDVVHLNLHKTFSTPHGGGGPGSGPICANKKLAPYMPSPIVAYDEQKDIYVWKEVGEKSIGRVRSFNGNILIILRAYCYIMSLGGSGIKNIAKMAVLSANYLKSLLTEFIPASHKGHCMHEFVLSFQNFKHKGIKAVDLAKRLIDKGFHPPTMYFPLIVPEAIMVEPTETESKDTLDAFANAIQEILNEMENQPDMVLQAPHNTIVQRLDEVKAVRNPKLTESQ